MSLHNELKKIKDLFEQGLIDEQEYKEMKRDAIKASSNHSSPSSTTTPSIDNLGTMIHTGDVTPSVPSSGLHAMETTLGKAETTIGSYRILHLLGEGGMGSVFKGRHKNEQVAEARGDVAIKMIHPNLAKDASFKARFIKEGLFGMSLQHPNVARVIDVVDEDGTLALLMDYIEGQELTEVIPSQGMTVENVIELLEPLASALDYLHGKGIVHRDMKPANIRIQSDGTPVILDFGIAKDTNETDSGMTQTGTAMGTQTYMAPEQMDAKRVTGAADQYALAMMAYQMLSGQFPWSAELSSARITMVKLTGDVESLDAVSEVSSLVSQAVMKGLNLNPENRFESCLAFVQTLQKAKESKQSEALAPSVSEPEKQTIPSKSSTSQLNIPDENLALQHGSVDTPKQLSIIKKVFFTGIIYLVILFVGLVFWGLG